MSKPDTSRPTYIGPHVVRVVGHYGQPDWAMPVSRRRHTRGTTVLDVVCVRTNPGSPVRRLTVDARWVKPANLLTVPESVLDNFVAAGTLKKCERQAWLRWRKRSFRNAEVTKGVTRRAEGSRVYHNLGGGVLTYEHIVLIR